MRLLQFRLVKSVWWVTLRDVELVVDEILGFQKVQTHLSEDLLNAQF